jgi:ribokinase
VAVILVTDSGQNTIVVIPGANDLYLPTDLDMDARHFADAQIAMLQLETPMETVLAAAQTAKRQGATVILDPAPAPRALPSDFYSYVDILTPNETEAAQLVHRTPGAFSPDEARHVARELQDLGVRVVIIKLGARGCLLAEGSDVTLIRHHRSRRRVQWGTKCGLLGGGLVGRSLQGGGQGRSALGDASRRSARDAQSTGN